MTVCVPQGVSPGSEFKVVVPPSSSPAPSGYTPINMQQGAPPLLQPNNNATNNYRGPQNMPVLPENQWHQDRLHARCEQCAGSFNLLNRKHHCRYCGRVLCDTCSSLKVKNLRACQPCFQRAYPPTLKTTNFGNNMQVLQQQQQPPMMSQHATVVQASAPPLPPATMTNNVPQTIDNNNVPVMQQHQSQPMMSQDAAVIQASAPPLPPATMTSSVGLQHSNTSNNLVKTDLINSATELRRKSFGGNDSQDDTKDGNNNKKNNNNYYNQLKVSDQPSSLATNRKEDQDELGLQHNLKNEAENAVAKDSQGRSQQHAQNVLVTATAVPVTNQQNVYHSQNLVVVNAVALDHNNLIAPTNTAPVGSNSAMQNNMTYNPTANNNNPRRINQNSGNGW